MVAPVLKRVNTIGIRFTKGVKSPAVLEKALEDKLGIPISELAGLAPWGPKKHLVKVKSSQEYERLVTRYVGFPIRVDNEHEIEVDDLSSYKDRVKVTRVPFEMTKDTLKELLGRYGQVDNLIMCNNRDRRYKDIPIDEAIAWMTVIDHIPSTLWIAETEQYMYFQYDKQPRTCHNCGSLNHISRQCEVFRHTRAKDRSNAVSIDLDAEIPSEDEGTPEENADPSEENEETPEENAVPPEENEETPEDNVTVTHAEDESESSGSDDSITFTSESDSDRNENAINVNYGFSCPICEVKCDTVHELNDHKKGHLDSYAKRAKSPPRSQFSASQPATSSHDQYTSDTSHKKRGASASPNSGNTPKRKTTWTKISKNKVDYKL